LKDNFKKVESYILVGLEEVTLQQKEQEWDI
jgi:hypothetical protein